MDQCEFSMLSHKNGNLTNIGGISSTWIDTWNHVYNQQFRRKVNSIKYQVKSEDIKSAYLISGAITCSMVVEIKAPSSPIKRSCVDSTDLKTEPPGKIKFCNRGRVL